MMNEFESKLEKLTRLTKAFEQADDSNKRSHLANELLCTLENTTLSARRYFSSFLKLEKHGREAHILPYHVEEHCAVEVTSFRMSFSEWISDTVFPPSARSSMEDALHSFICHRHIKP